MTESFKPPVRSPQEKQSEQLSPEKIYARLPGANPRVFHEGGGSGMEHYAFPPVTLSVIPEFFDDELLVSKEERSLFKFSNEPVVGQYEVTCCARSAGDTNRIDKMIKQLDTENPWQPAMFEHLLAFRQMYADEFPGMTIVAPGTEQRSHMPRLDPDGTLHKHYRHGGFNSSILFLIVRRKSVA